MWQDRLKEIIYILENSDVNEIDVTFLGRRYRVVKAAPVVPHNPGSAAVNLAPPSEEKSLMSPPSTESSSPTVEVLSPMPGTFYRAPEPEADPFVKVGDKVKKGDTLCIIEAMKIMNEIECETNGVIKKIIVEDAQPVEYNQVLFLIEPA